MARRASSEETFIVSEAGWQTFGAFVAGATYEGFAVAWVSSQLARAPVRTALVSMTQGIMQVSGLVAAVRSTGAALALVVGYGVGSYVVVRLGRLLNEKAPIE